MKLDRPSASSSASHSGIPSPESQTTPEEVVVVSRGGSPVLALNGTSSSALEAMDLSLPQLRRRKSLDKGYDGEIRREPKGEQEIARGLLQKSYLSGPTPVYQHLLAPRPLGRPRSSSSGSSTSTESAASPQFTQEPLEQDFDASSDPHSDLYDLPRTVEESITASYAALQQDDSTPSRPRPRAFTLSQSHYGSSGTFPSTARAGPLPAPTIVSRFKLFWLQLFANAASAAFLSLIVVWALSSRSLTVIFDRLRGKQATERKRREWDDQKTYENERVVKDIRYYANSCGFDVVEQTVETKDGYLLKMFKIEVLGRKEVRHSDGRGGYPVLIQHGLFQSCGSFITSEERSLAFWLAKNGNYQVYLGNNRGCFDMGHVQLSRNDPRFWDYNIKELALYDLPAMVDHVRKETGYDTLSFIGHSQGNATMFCSLAQGMVPELGEKLSIFIALAPAVYAGPLTTGFPFGALKSMKWKTWRKWFGVLDFIPLMRISYDYVPSKPFGLLGYQMFAFLFNWTDTNWLLRRKPKMFRFTPAPVSSASIFWWTGYGGFSTRGCVLDPNVDKWFDGRFPPLAIHHGGKDFLVLTEPLLARLTKNEPDVKVIRVQKLEEGEHCDFFWHVDAVELCFHSFLEDIEKTRPRFPEEEPSQ